MVSFGGNTEHQFEALEITFLFCLYNKNKVDKVTRINKRIKLWNFFSRLFII